MPDAVGASVGSAQVIDALQYDFVGGQIVAVGASAASSVVFSYPYTAAVITSTTNCWFSIGGVAAVHTNGSDYLPAGMKLKIKFPVGAVISVIQDTAGGFLSIVPAATQLNPALLLDGLAATAAAYSLRRLNSSYGGPALNIRRSTDNTTQNIGFIGGNFDIGSFNAFVGGGQGFAATWYDQSGNGLHLTQGAAASQPQVIPSTINGLPGLRFSETTNIVLFVNSAGLCSLFTAGGFVSVVLNSGPITGNRRIAQASNGCWQTILNSNGTIQFQQSATGNGIWTTTGTMSNAIHQLDFQYSSALLANVPTITIDRGAQTITSTQPTGTLAAPGTTFLMGGSAANGSGADIGEVILYSNVSLPFANASAVRANQKAYWGTP